MTGEGDDAPREGTGRREIAALAVRGSFHNLGSTLVTASLGFLRAVLLARLVLPEQFGLAALAAFFNGLANQLRTFGMDDALIQRPILTRAVLSTYFSLRLTLLVASLGILVACSPLIGRAYPAMPQLQAVIVALAAISLLRGLNAMQEAVLTRSLAFPTLVRANIAGGVTMTIIAPLLAWYGAGVWSLVGGELCGQLARGIVIWGLRRAWLPEWGFDPQVARWFWRFGVRIWTDHNLNFVLERFDDFWTGTFLGELALGLYSRAYELAGYTRRVVFSPLHVVAFATFSRLQDDRARLSQAFEHSTGLVIRATFLVAGMLILTAPETIPLLLGARWVPMITAFQLMVVYTIFDPVARGARDLVIASGRVGLVVRIRALQCLVFLPAVVLCARFWGIAGVAVAADLMMLIGAVLLLRTARRFIDYSARRLLLWPTVALGLSLVTVLSLAPLWTQLDLWTRLAGKVVVVGIGYLAVLWLAERNQLLFTWRLAADLWRRRAQ